MGTSSGHAVGFSFKCHTPTPGSLYTACPHSRLTEKVPMALIVSSVDHTPHPESSNGCERIHAMR